MMLQAMQARQIRGDCSVMRRYIAPLAASWPDRHWCRTMSFRLPFFGL
jgi:hypothetical protein